MAALLAYITPFLVALLAIATLVYQRIDRADFTSYQRTSQIDKNMIEFVKILTEQADTNYAAITKADERYQKLYETHLSLQDKYLSLRAQLPPLTND